MKQIHERKRSKITGKGKGHSFLRLPHFLTDSEQYGNLTAYASKLLTEIARKYRGKNNGDLSIPWVSLRTRGFNSEWTVKRARDELIDAGFILVTRHGGNHLCALYAITWEAIDECPGKGLEIAPTHTAPNDWQKKHKMDCTTCSDSPEITASRAVIAA
jgi:hypothetical protein